ncbi:cysteine--tRNA ligase [Patescibacteria group bacterium]|nr:cysteine--tRNA ligase [Patescibacteria group bacterium]
MDIKLYNTFSRTIETFKPQKAGRVSMYQCGPTVYDTPHIGNYRTFVMDDLIRRVFEYNGYEVDQVMNVTDVDDKTIRRSREEGTPLHELTSRYEKLFVSGLEALEILPPKHLLRATENIGAMVELISDLLAKGAAYKADDGVYMDISKVAGYGQLAHIDSGRISKERISNDEYDKENAHDFALWKFKTDEGSDAVWEAPFGAGRPGWHIECSAMSMKALGPTLDLHTGGMDLIFPHHTNEIAQSETATGKPFANYWMHGGFMTIKEEKMAKSKNNFLKLEDLESERISPLAFRYWLLTAHYRSPIDFTLEAVKSAQNALIRLMSVIGIQPEGGKAIQAYKDRFLGFVNDDLNTPKAVALTWELLKDGSQPDADKRATILDFDRVFGLRLASGPRFHASPADIPAEITALAEAREEARRTKDWKKADALRSEIESRGFRISDKPKGYSLEPA